MSNILSLENAQKQKKAELNKGLAVDLSSRIMEAVDKFESDIAFPSMCAVFAQLVKKRIHPTNFMDAIGQFAQEIHRMVFDPSAQAQVQEVAEEVRAELSELTQNANRWIVFSKIFNGDIEHIDDDFHAFLQELDGVEELNSYVDARIKELEAAAKRVQENG